MKHLFIVFLFAGLNIYSQKLHHQMISAQGTSVQLSNGMYVGQTIGQQSVNGNYIKDGKLYGQGFQQSVWSNYIKNNINNLITTIVYPNPFLSTIQFQFSQPIKETISLALFDVRGRLVYSAEKRAIDNILTIDFGNLPSSNYLIRLSTINYKYYTQIIKQE
jgi:hypothetical protein